MRFESEMLYQNVLARPPTTVHQAPSALKINGKILCHGEAAQQVTNLVLNATFITVVMHGFHILAHSDAA